ncbi:MAG: 3-oxoacyl-ACP synthase [Bacteroidota bacterium]
MQKQKLIEACNDYFRNKITSLMAIIQELTESSNSESKSSAGDKHETAKAMAQLEREKLGLQLKEAEKQLAEFERIDFQKTFHKVEQGSLVETNKGYFFIAGSVGRVLLGTQTVFVISVQSPLSSALFSHKVRDTVSFNGVSYIIKTIT